jgi:hypothetical protein
MSEPSGLSKLGAIKPRAAEPGQPEAELEDVRAIADAHGFVQRDPPRPRRRRNAVTVPVAPFTARVSVTSLERFIAYCDRERVSYREGFDHLVELLEADERRGEGR